MGRIYRCTAAFSPGTMPPSLSIHQPQQGKSESFDKHVHSFACHPTLHPSRNYSQPWCNSEPLAVPTKTISSQLWHTWLSPTAPAVLPPQMPALVHPNPTYPCSPSVVPVSSATNAVKALAVHLAIQLQPANLPRVSTKHSMPTGCRQGSIAV